MVNLAKALHAISFISVLLSSFANVNSLLRYCIAKLKASVLCTVSKQAVNLSKHFFFSTISSDRILSKYL